RGHRGGWSRSASCGLLPDSRACVLPATLVSKNITSRADTLDMAFPTGYHSLIIMGEVNSGEVCFRSKLRGARPIRFFLIFFWLLISEFAFTDDSFSQTPSASQLTP